MTSEELANSQDAATVAVAPTDEGGSVFASGGMLTATEPVEEQAAEEQAAGEQAAEEQAAEPEAASVEDPAPAPAPLPPYVDDAEADLYAFLALPSALDGASGLAEPAPTPATDVGGDSGASAQEVAQAPAAEQMAEGLAASEEQLEQTAPGENAENA